MSFKPKNYFLISQFLVGTKIKPCIRIISSSQIISIYTVKQIKVILTLDLR